ncbi:DNA repair protein RecN [Candidatus Oleimmundimicrobium sp.]|uniref:DNA repair protein RecN n=1 Tax=Candidatus Oleimmundimicrobium sp. TaxID=3060597 RepID=UPI00271E47FE|nr:DNA repair protein RecN [Candidatus Oleimmundimicrobium sp.]MDO8886525.1 DNA repair protein RecN [Candidatus Oleimmundimicrobium sp.]
MLQELHIKNLALIDESYVEFDKGLNVLTGETGAGKTVLVQAINLLVGERADYSFIRTGCEEACVEGSFLLQNTTNEALEYLDTADLDEDARQFVISRKISRDGKNKCYINGKIVTLNCLKEMGNFLVDFHGQHEHQSLLKTSSHLEFLDRYAGREDLDLRGKYSKTYEELKKMSSNIKKLKNETQERSGKEDLLRFQIEEIKNSNLRSGEEEDLIKERDVSRNAEKICEAVNLARDALSGDSQYSAYDFIAKAEGSVARVSEFDVQLDEIYKRIESVSLEVDDLGQLLRAYVEKFQYNPNRLDNIETRLATINALKRKYGETIDEILRFSNQAQVELDSLMTAESLLGNSELKLAEKYNELSAFAEELSKKRKKAALDFEKEVIKQLCDLNMPKVKFGVQILSKESTELDDGLTVLGKKCKFNSDGVDTVEFLISPNPGEPLKPLVKIASGGEMSRIMLALKIVLANIDSIPTLIFDEIDSGVGGKTAGFVGQKMNFLSETHQLICITHLPQIAAFANRHFRVFKKEAENKTQTFVETLSFNDRIAEIARMLGGKGDPTELSKKHALELINLAKKIIGRHVV